MIPFGVFVTTFFVLSAVFGLVIVPTAQAVCPVCTAAVIGGLGISRIIGIDDSVSGVWVGGLILSSSFWMTDWAARKGYLKKIKTGLLISIFAASLYLVTFIPMMATNFIGHPANKILGIDKLIFGAGVGTLAFLIGVWTDRKEREIKGKQLFHFQKVVFPISALLVSSLVLYFATK